MIPQTLELIQLSNALSLSIPLDLRSRPTWSAPLVMQARVPTFGDKNMTTASYPEQVRTIHRLPNEILLAIFDLASATALLDNFPQVVSLTHVCRRWMEILLNCGRIWSNIHIYGQDINRLDAQIQRCQQAPLLVFIEPPQITTESNKLLRNIYGAASLIRKLRNQVKLLQVDMDCALFHRLLGCEWPSLKELIFTDSCPVGPDLHGDHRADPIRGELPELKYLFVQGGSSWPINIATHLTAFKLKGTESLRLETLAEFLRRNTSLQTLELINLNVRTPSSCHREGLIELPYLRELTVRDATCGSALALLRLPSLKQLQISSSGKQDPWTDSPWTEFCHPLLITSLEAHYRSSWRDGITVVGWTYGMDTRFLRFTEFNSFKALGTALFGSLSNSSLSSVTSLSLIRGMPEDRMSLSTITAICDLLKYLPRVESMRLRPSKLVVEVVGRLNDDAWLCPRLKELAVRVTEKAYETVLRLVAEMRARADGGGREVITVERLRDV